MKHPTRWIALAVAVVVALVAVVLATQVGGDPRADATKSQLVGEAAPAFTVRTLDGEIAPIDDADELEALPAPQSEATTPALPEGDADVVGQLRRKIEQKEADIAKIMAAYRKLKNENEGARQRIEQVQKRRFEQSKNDFIARFVEVLDNLDRAIEAIENNFDSDSVLQGIILVRSRLVALLREEGLEKIFVGGQPFDPMHSEAAGLEPVEDPTQDNVVLREIQRGYYLRGILLRPSRVVVGRYPGAKNPPPKDP